MRNRFSMGRKLSRIPIDSVKNIVQIDVTLATLTVAVVPLAFGAKPADIDPTVLGNVANVEAGAMVKGFDLSFRVYNRNANLPGQEKVVIFLRRNPANVLPAPTVAACNSLGVQTWKRNVFHVQQAKPPGPDGIPMGFVGIKIPRKFHKMELNDSWELIISNNSGGSIDICGACIYKWYR